MHRQLDQDVRCTAAYANDTLAPPYGGGTGNPANRPVCNAPGSGNLKTNGTPSTEPDYATNGSSVASLNVVLPFRITDQTNSGPSGTCPPTCPDDATVADITFAIAFDCHVSPSTSIGGTCLPRYTSAQAECGCMPAAHVTKRSNIQVGVNGGIFVDDGGTDGYLPPSYPLNTDVDNPKTYATQGLFLP